MSRVKMKHENWSTRVFPEYKYAINKSNKLLETIDLEGELADCIYSGNGTIGSYCIIYLEFDNFILMVNLNLEEGKHRIDSSIEIPELKEQYGNYCNYEELVKKLKEISQVYKVEKDFMKDNNVK